MEVELEAGGKEKKVAQGRVVGREFGVGWKERRRRWGKGGYPEGVGVKGGREEIGDRAKEGC